MNGHRFYQHSEISVGYTSLRKYIVKQCGGVCQYLLPLLAYLVILAAVGDFPL